MLTINYNDSTFEKLALQAVQSKEEFSIRVSGWKRKPIKKGLSHFRNYKQGRGRSLMLIPYGFITPTFWVVCVKADFENLMPDWQTEDGDLVVRFARKS